MSNEREVKASCGCYVTWNGQKWIVTASAFTCDHRQGDYADGAPPRPVREGTP